MEKEKEGFPITSLREINMLLKCGSHPNIVNVKVITSGILFHFLKYIFRSNSYLFEIFFCVLLFNIYKFNFFSRKLWWVLAWTKFT